MDDVISLVNIKNLLPMLFAKILLANPQAKTADLSFNDLSSTPLLIAFNALPPKKGKLERLDLSNNNMMSELADKFFDRLNSLEIQELDLSSQKKNKRWANRVVSALKKIESLRSLNISNNDLDDKSAENIADLLNSLPSLNTVNLGSNNFTSKGLEKIFLALTNHGREISVDISSNEQAIGEDGLAKIANLLPRTPITKLALWTDQNNYDEDYEIFFENIWQSKIDHLDVGFFDDDDKIYRSIEKIDELTDNYKNKELTIVFTTAIYRYPELNIGDAPTLTQWIDGLSISNKKKKFMKEFFRTHPNIKINIKSWS